MRSNSEPYLDFSDEVLIFTFRNLTNPSPASISTRTFSLKRMSTTSGNLAPTNTYMFLIAASDEIPAGTMPHFHTPGKEIGRGKRQHFFLFPGIGTWRQRRTVVPRPSLIARAKERSPKGIWYQRTLMEFWTHFWSFKHTTSFARILMYFIFPQTIDMNYFFEKLLIFIFLLFK